MAAVERGSAASFKIFKHRACVAAVLLVVVAVVIKCVAGGAGAPLWLLPTSVRFCKSAPFALLLTGC